jgi:FG-GAP repeat protein
VLLLCGVLATILSTASGQYTQQGSKLVGTGAVGDAFQGASVAISGDRNTIIVGGQEDDRATGAAWVYGRVSDVWSQQAKLVGGGTVRAGSGNIGQGAAVSLSEDGNTALVGGPYDDGETGAAWVFTRTDGVWSQEGEKLTGMDIAGHPRFGVSVALSADGNTAVIGGPADDGGPGAGVGAAWVFTRSGGVWSQQGPKLVGTAAIGGALQGASVAISGDGGTVLVGGFMDNAGAGAAWVFTRSGAEWTQQGGKLVGTGAAGEYSSQGASVSLSSDGNTAIIGGPTDDRYVGAAWVFTGASGVWTQDGEKLVGTGAAGIAYQGNSVALSGNGSIAIVGGPQDDGPRSIGATWVYERADSGWGQAGDKLVGSDAVGLSRQGGSVALSGDGRTAVVGGKYDNNGVGAAWVFEADSSQVLDRS